MANKATMVYFDGIREDNKTTRIFRVTSPRQDNIWVSSFKKGIATIEFMPGRNTNQVAEIVIGCFNKESNFVSELLKSFDCDKNTALTGIKFKFNERTFMVIKEEDDENDIYGRWHDNIKANEKKECLEIENYMNMNTHKYCTEKAIGMKSANRRKIVKKDVIAVDENTEMYFKDEEAMRKWKQLVDVSKDSSTKTVITYAIRWAKYMQYLMEKHNKTVDKIAKNSSYCAIDTIGEINDSMCVCAVNMLVQFWKYGEELRKWYDKEFWIVRQ